MKIVIDIDDEDYKRIQDISDVFNSLTSRAYSAIRNGTPLSDANVGKLDGDPVDIDKAVEHYEKTLETLEGIDLEVADE